MRLPFSVRKPILACGADLKGAFALANGREAFLCEGFGDLSGLDNFERYEKAVAKAVKSTGIRPAVVAHDLHPGYFSTRFAEDFARRARCPKTHAVQHHEAHIASCIVDNDIKGGVIGAAFDGTGYGRDGNIWGGEFFAGGLKGFERAAHLEYIPMPGADAAVREPWRMAESYLYKAYGMSYLKKFKKRGQAPLFKMIDKGINSPLTSSAGRLFDAAASLVLGRKKAGFEAELPIAFEKIAAKDREEVYRYTVKIGPSSFRGAPASIGTAIVIKSVMDDIREGVDKAVISARFHNTVARIISGTAEFLGRKSGIKKIVLSGGVFQNKYLTGKASDLLGKKGFEVFVHLSVSATDSGIPIGQAAIANARTPSAFALQ